MLASPLTSRVSCMLLVFGLTAALAPFAIRAAPAPPGPYRFSTGIYGWMTAAPREGREFDLAWALAGSREAGMRAIEVFMSEFGQGKAEQFRRQILDAGMMLLSVYAGGPLVPAEAAEKTIRETLELVTVVAEFFPGIYLTFDPAGGAKSDQELREEAARLNELGRALQKRGIKLAVHGHTPGYADGARELKAMLRDTDPALVGFCIDVHWNVKAGNNPLEIVKTVGDRLVALHLRNGERGTWTESLDEGTDIDFSALAAYLAARRLTPYLVIELAYEEGTKVTRSHAKNLAASREYLEKIFLPAGEGSDIYGGWYGLRAASPGYFDVTVRDGKSWLVDPAGCVFLSKGVCHVSYGGDPSPALGFSPYGRLVAERYGSAGAWAKETAAHLRSWGFNTIGAWSSDETFAQGMPYTVIVNLAAAAGADWLKGGVPDYFAPSFKVKAFEAAMRHARPRARDPLLIGYFTDNELRWGADWRSTQTLLDSYLAFGKESIGKQKAVDLLIDKLGGAAGVSTQLGIQPMTRDELLAWQGSVPPGKIPGDIADLFLELSAREYFRVCWQALREADPNHLNLGCRMAGNAPDPILKAARGYVDVFSLNWYEPEAPVRMIENAHALTGAPVMIGEFSFKAMDSGLPNTRGAARPVATQADRARGFEKYVRALLATECGVGYHWFQYFDEPKEGRFDGENSNFGIVTIKDEPWEVLLKTMRAINERAEALHAAP
jgi:sugar phosphate isomerase/epimerase